MEQDYHFGRGRGSRDHWHDEGDIGYGESRSKLFTEQSVSDRGHLLVATAPLEQEAESGNNQTQHIESSARVQSESTAKYVLPS